MSPVEELETWRDTGFPRVSGDEPAPPAPQALPSAFSPRERG